MKALFLFLTILSGVVFLMLFSISVLNRLQYMERIIYLESYIKEAIINEANFKYILDQFDEIRGFNVNRDRTAMLFNHFSLKYINFMIDNVYHKKDGYKKYQILNKKLNG
jgi:hypothetical protein